MKRFPGPEAPRATRNGNPVPLLLRPRPYALTGTLVAPSGFRATVRSLRRAQWSVVSILALLALVTLRLPCTASALLKGEQGSACCAAMMDDDGKGACCEGASPAPKAELAPPALALLPTGAPALPEAPETLLPFVNEPPSHSLWAQTMALSIAPRAPPWIRWTFNT